MGWLDVIPVFLSSYWLYFLWHGINVFIDTWFPVACFQALARFRRAVYLIRIFSSLCLSIRRYADQDKSRQYDFYYIRDMLPGDDDEPTTTSKEMPITFNKHLFSRDNTVKLFCILIVKLTRKTNYFSH